MRCSHYPQLAAFFDPRNGTRGAVLRFRRRLLLSLYRELFPLAGAFDPKCSTLWLFKHTGQFPARFGFQT